MPTFTYEAIDTEGVIHRGEIVADKREQALEEIQSQRLSPIRLETVGEVRAAAAALGLPFRGISTLDKIILTRHLSVMIRAGLGVMDSLDILIKDAEKQTLRKFLEQAKYNLERGQPLSATFASYPKQFPPVFVGLLKAGELSGNLQQSLEQLSDQMKKDYELTKKAIGVMIYPAILASASMFLVIFLLTIVVPRITKAFLDIGSALPLITRFFIALSNIMTQTIRLPFLPPIPWVPFVVVGGLVGSLIFFTQSNPGRGFMAKILWRIPVTRNLIKRMALARFARTFGNLLRAGLSVLETLDITADSVGSLEYRGAILKAGKDISRGIPLTDVFQQRSDLFPHLLTSMMAVGEKTGTLEELLLTVSDFYEEEADRQLQTLVTFLEPGLLLFMGVVVGSIALSILLPIYQLVGSLQAG